MKRLVYVVLVVLLALVLLPFVGPALGLAEFQSAAEGPGTAVPIANGRLNVYQQGEGADVVLVHGQPGSAAMMARLAQALVAQGFRVTRYDRMGWGHSGQRATDAFANPTAHARDLLQLIDALSLRQPLVVGYSYGGGVAMEANRLAPATLPVLALVSSVGDPQRRGQSSWLGRVMLAPLTMRWAFGLDVIAEQVSKGIFAALQSPEQLAPADSRALLASLALPGVPGNWARERAERYQGFDGYQPDKVQACTLVLHGDADLIVRPQVARYVSQQIPAARLQWLTDSGHAVVMTQPELLAEVIATHARQCAG